ncbi:hypothetical protein [Sphingomonas sp. TREG-RG-20F-R18-01]|uniref:hypothetical protein n=1 Tax=Sphingomonas sp. TREG-RG-20F-R18-01 TaxID=2914982 RepID=UPI001F59CE3D|nr:hypothetical protein [Sphingomonas sp. TREG-RG-20F-R18-01]
MILRHAARTARMHRRSACCREACKGGRLDHRHGRRDYPPPRSDDQTRRLALLRLPATGSIVGVSALKAPGRAYRAHKFEQAGVAITGFEHVLELGYVVIAKHMQGRRLSRGLVEEIAADLSQRTFASTDSNTMKHDLAGSGFTQFGARGRARKACSHSGLWCRSLKATSPIANFDFSASDLCHANSVTQRLR